MIYATCLNEQQNILDEYSLIIENMDLYTQTSLIYINEAGIFSTIIDNFKKFIKTIMTKLREWYNNIFHKKFIESQKKYNEAMKKANNDMKSNNDNKFDTERYAEVNNQLQIEKYVKYMQGSTYKELIYYSLEFDIDYIKFDANIDYTKNPQYFDNREYTLEFDKIIKDRQQEIFNIINKNIDKDHRINSLSDLNNIKVLDDNYVCLRDPKKDYGHISDMIKDYEYTAEYVKNDAKNLINKLSNIYEKKYINKATSLVQYFENQQNLDQEQKYKDMSAKVTDYLKSYISTAMILMNNDIKAITAYYNMYARLYNDSISSFYVLQNKIINICNDLKLDYK